MGVWVDLFILPAEDKSLTGRDFISLVSDLVTDNLVVAPCAVLAGDLEPSPLGIVNLISGVQPSRGGLQRLYYGLDTSILLQTLNQAVGQDLCIWFTDLNVRHNEVSQWLNRLSCASGSVLLFAFNEPRRLFVESIGRCSEEPPLYSDIPPSAAQAELLKRLAAGEDIDECERPPGESAAGIELTMTHSFAMTGKGIPDSVRFCRPLRQLFLKHFGSPFREGLFFS